MASRRNVSSRAPGRRLRIQILSQYYDPEIGAAQIRLKALAKELIRRGHDVDVVTALPNHPLGRIYDGYRGKLMMREQRDGASVRRVWIHASTGSGGGRIGSFVSFAVMAILPMVRTPRPDITLVQSPPLFAAVPALIDRLLRRRRFGLITGDLWPDVVVDLGKLESGPIRRMLYALERWSYAKATIIMPVTPGQVEILRTQKGVPADKIITMNNGVDTELFRAGPPTPSMVELLSPAGERVILYAGTHGYMHGLDVLLDAAPLVRAVHPDARFVLVGGGSERDRLVRRVDDEEIEGVTMLEPRPLEDIAEMYRVAYAGVCTIRDARTLDVARPVKIFPTMASERPVIFSGHGEGAGIVENTGAGIVVRPEDPAALADAIIAVLDDPERAAEMGRNGRKVVEAEFSWPTIVGQFVETLERRL